MKLIGPLIICVGLVTCSESVRLQHNAKSVEFVSQEYIGAHGSRCKHVGDFDVEAVPAEVSAHERMSVLDVKAKNLAAERDATHLLRWPPEEWSCRKDGTPEPDTERVCSRQSITAYQCLIGRGT